MKVIGKARGRAARHRRSRIRDVLYVFASLVIAQSVLVYPSGVVAGATLMHMSWVVARRRFVDVHTAGKWTLVGYPPLPPPIIIVLLSIPPIDDTLSTRHPFWGMRQQLVSSFLQYFMIEMTMRRSVACTFKLNDRHRKSNRKLNARTQSTNGFVFLKIKHKFKNLKN